MDGDCSVPMNVAGPTEPERGHKSALKTWAPCNKHWGAAAALLAVALCAGVLCVTLDFKTQEQGHAETNNDVQRTLRQISRNVRAAIHLEGKINNELKTSVQWMREVDQYHAEGGLELVDNEIVIPRNGLYFVYSQASFRVSCHADEDDQSGPRLVHLSHTVKRWSDSYSTNKDYETILHSVRTACEKTPSGGGDAQGKWFSAVYMGAVFRLEAGDRLKTVMAPKMLPDVDVGRGNTFFGVFSL